MAEVLCGAYLAQPDLGCGLVLHGKSQPHVAVVHLHGGRRFRHRWREDSGDLHTSTPETPDPGRGESNG